MVASVSIDFVAARVLLDQAWSKTGSPDVCPSTAAMSLLDAILRSENITFKYILVTGLLGKCVDPGVHPRALQTGSKLRKSYDARSLCHKVVVTFEKEKGDLWGLSNEPFVNKPARHREHDKKNKQLRDKQLAAALHDVLDLAHDATPNEVFRMLVYALRVGKIRAESRVDVAVEVHTTYRRIIEFVRQFLEESDGGARLAGVVGAFVTLLNENFTVHVHPPNVSDTFSKTAGDIEILHRGKTISAFECKHRSLNIDDVRHGIRKAKHAGVFEYCFVCAAGLAEDQQSKIDEVIAVASHEIDVQVFNILTVLPSWTTALNPKRRAAFGVTLATILRVDMHRAEVANKAAELWNALEQ
jgi:SacI restriction endonuclease